jgi:hypothetical protein
MLRRMTSFGRRNQMPIGIGSRIIGIILIPSP